MVPALRGTVIPAWSANRGLPVPSNSGMVQNRASRVGSKSVEFFVSNYTDSIFLRSKPGRQAIVRLLAITAAGREASARTTRPAELTPSTQTAKEAVAQ